MSLSEWVAFRCELALLLELSATPKPGLVDRLHDFPETSFNHFLASASSLRPWFRRAAQRGAKTLGRGLGRIIFEGARCFIRAQSGGNTHLGSWLLIAPLAAAAGAARKVPLTSTALSRNLRRVLGSMDWRDTVDIFRAVAYVSPGGLGRVAYLDVGREETYEEIRRERLSPLEALKPYAGFDMVAREWTSRYKTVLGYGLRALKRNLSLFETMNDAIVQTFLQLLAKYPDTHIARKGGKDLARRVSHLADEALKLGGLLTREGRRVVERVDRKLRRSRRMRPGATADLLSATLAAALLTGWSP